MSKHTLGPWKVIDGDQHDHVFAEAFPNKRICNVFGGLKCPSGAANARLIAAAPELLESLKFLLARYVQIANSGDAGFWDPEKEPPVMEARAAIAKAEGCLQTFDCNAGDHADCCPAK